jgi:hypothetical protein
VSQQTKISDDRLAQIIDGDIDNSAFDWEIPIMAAELLARRASARQEHMASMRMMLAMRESPEKGEADGPDVPDGPVSEGFAPGFEERGGKSE